MSVQELLHDLNFHELIARCGCWGWVDVFRNKVENARIENSIGIDMVDERVSLVELGMAVVVILVVAGLPLVGAVTIHFYRLWGY